jgi:hypothetical protein
MAVLVIVFAWLPYSWSKIAITILGVLLAVLALMGICCCTTMAKEKDKAAEKTEE